MSAGAAITGHAELDEVQVAIFLIGKILVKTALGDPGTLGNPANRDVFIIVRRKLFQQNVEQARALFFWQIKVGCSGHGLKSKQENSACQDQQDPEQEV